MAAFLLLRTFLVAGVSAHYTGSSLPRTTGAAPKATACAPSEPNDRLEVAAAPRAEPKAKVKTPAADPLGLWGLPKSEGPRGPSIFKLNQGRAIDVLRKDYPRFFTAKPDLSIFAKNVELHDNSGKRLAGIKQYERVFDALRFLRRTTMQDAQVGIRLVADDKSIRVRWNAKLWMRDPATGLTTMVNGEPAIVQMDGVSVYDLDKDGLIERHRLENIVFTGQEQAEPIQLAFAWPASGFPTPELAVPFFKNANLALRTRGETSGGAARPAPRRAPPPQASAADDEAEARETPMQRAARERSEDEAKRQRLAELRTPKEEKKDLFGLSAPQQCETSYDCEAPMVCCDLLFATVCCTGGLLIPTADRTGTGALQRQAIPIPVERDNEPSAPPQYPGGPSF